MGERRKISLVVADVDGTLVTEQKVLTQRAPATVQVLHRAGVPTEEIATIGDQPNDVVMFSGDRGSVSPWATRQIRSRSKPMSQRIRTTTRVLPAMGAFRSAVCRLGG